MTPSPYQLHRAIRHQAKVEKRSTGAARRRAADKLIARLHTKQLELHNDPAKKKAALCTRQAGKTFVCVTELLYTALTKKRSFSIYINESRAECLRIVWLNRDDGGLFRMIEDVLVPEGMTVGPPNSGADIEVNRTYLTLYFTETEATISLIGCDDEDAVKKLRGPTYDLVIIDEAQKTPHLKQMAESSLFPALMKKRGTIIMAGTPGRVPAGIFFDVTRIDGRARPGWSVHRFSFVDNEAIPDRFNVIEETKKENEWDDDNDQLLREWFGLWIADSSLLVYIHASLPDEKRYHDLDFDELDFSYWRFLVGCDLGFFPALWAYVVWGFNEDEPILYEVDSFSMPNLNTDQQAAILTDLMEIYEPDSMVCDAGAGGLKQIVEGDYCGRFGLPCSVAQKKDKDSAIEVFNAHKTRGGILLKKGSPLDLEMLGLPWLERKPGLRRMEDPKFANHACDGGLYAARESDFYAGEEDEEEPELGSEEWVEAKFERHRAKLRGEVVDEDIVDDGDVGPTSYYGW